MEGVNLIRLLIESTGLPKDAVEPELNRILKQLKMSANQLTLEDVRDVLAYYVQEVLVEAKDRAVI